MKKRTRTPPLVLFKLVQGSDRVIRVHVGSRRTLFEKKSSALQKIEGDKARTFSHHMPLVNTAKWAFAVRVHKPTANPITAERIVSGGEAGLVRRLGEEAKELLKNVEHLLIRGRGQGREKG